ncbi:class I SAM-dependent methyltransferase [Daejeonella lutea]|uniref:Ubiquinone/menaquinone biosynthesis C-methylase UbiE n=1 Tax=Daejeonella lutea TaxID=572036 RepID=A0A1T5FAZ9_9SPHI|nr:class I SAM-dependent methyltransferase [Daejeonella lutea]SKB93306.1 Ubiquinone/menaquinone biosynthesis C-methylase UbiE [Daejeonella lutea]
MNEQLESSTFSEKDQVKDFWNEASCGEDLYLAGFTEADYTSHSAKRYQLEPEIIAFGEFERFRNKKTLEIGVGLGADHQKLAEAGAILSGVDLTQRAINHTTRRFELNGLTSELAIADAENLPFAGETFEAVYSWGVLHHSPDTQRAIDEVYRVLKPGGFAKIMIYHKYSIVGLMLWLRYGLLRFKPLITMETIYSKYLESPGTKAYSRKEAEVLFKKFRIESISTPLNHADLLTSAVGQRHRGVLLNIMTKIWPRTLIKKFFPSNGIELMVTLYKS